MAFALCWRQAPCRLNQPLPRPLPTPFSCGWRGAFRVRGLSAWRKRPKTRTLSCHAAPQSVQQCTRALQKAGADASLIQSLVGRGSGRQLAPTPAPAPVLHRKLPLWFTTRTSTPPKTRFAPCSATPTTTMRRTLRRIALFCILFSEPSCAAKTGSTKRWMNLRNLRA